MTDQNELPAFRRPRLHTCPVCGRPVEIKYICGIGYSLRGAVKNPFAGSYPAWYILCGCGNNMLMRCKVSSFETMQKVLTRLGREWNKQMTNEPIVERLVLVKDEKPSDP